MQFIGVSHQEPLEVLPNLINMEAMVYEFMPKIWGRESMSDPLSVPYIDKEIPSSGAIKKVLKV